MLRVTQKRVGLLAMLVVAALVAVFVSSQLSGSAEAAGKGGAGGDRLIGLWQAVQVSDGSIATLSIRDLNDDGVYETSYHEFWFGTCSGDRGISNGTLTVVEPGIYMYDRSVVCPTLGTQVFYSNPFEYEPSQDVLVLQNSEDFARQDVFHRISTR